jgi:hypothetical protein
MTLSFWPTALRISAGAIVWALHFAATYGFTALACARGLGAAVPYLVSAATMLAILSIAVLLARSMRREGFEEWLTFAVAAIALVAVVFETVPVFLVDACA